MKSTRHILMTALALAGLSYAENAPADATPTPAAPEATAPESPEATATPPATTEAVITAEEANKNDEEDAMSPEMEEASNFIMHYYQNPQPDKIDALIRQWAGFFPSAGECSAIPSTLVFFGEVFKANPDRVEGWMQTVSTLPQDWQQVFQWSLRYAKGEEEDITTFPYGTPERFDACWGGFMASGDKKYPEFVLRHACEEEAPNSINLTIRVAAWSCCSFIINYPEMKEIARAWFANTATEAEKLNFALRSNEQVQTAVFDKVLLTEQQKEELNAQREEEGRKKAEQMQQTADFIMHYFEHPQPDKVGDMLTLSGELDPQAELLNPAMQRMFYGALFKAHPDRLEGWAQLISTLPEAWQEQLQWSLRYARGEEPHPTAAEEPTPETLLACVGSYMATGDRIYPEYLLKLGSTVEDKPIHQQAASAASACISLYATARDIAREWFAKASDEQKMAFAQRVDDDTQHAIFDKVLHSQRPAEEYEAMEDPATPDEADEPLNESCVPEAPEGDNEA